MKENREGRLQYTVGEPRINFTAADTVILIAHVDYVMANWFNRASCLVR